MIIEEKIKSKIINIKNKSKESYEKNENTSQEYAENKVKKSIHNNTYYIKRLYKKGNVSLKKIREKIQKEKNKNIKVKNNKIKLVKNIVKPTNRKIKKVKQVEKNSVKMSKKTVQITKQILKSSIQVMKVSVKTTVSIIKNIITAFKSFISIIVAGSWVAVVVIVIVCIIAIICSSIFGIFFSNERGVSNKTMNSVIEEINIDFTNRINEIKTNTEYDECNINSNVANWKDVLLLYSVIISNGEDKSDVIILDNDKINKLKEIFWQMNIISYSLEEKDMDITNEEESINTEKIKILHINITNKSLQEMSIIYNLSKKQIEQIIELQKDEYSLMWNYLLYGISNTCSNIVEIALSQVGNVGGQKYWQWYGFQNRVEWCAIFVSWCAEQCGYIDSGRIPKFASCNYGVDFFKSKGNWANKDYMAKSGDIIFFDWNKDGIVEHVGIVEKIENGKVYTIEGNSEDKCQKHEYILKDNVILGYGII